MKLVERYVTAAQGLFSWLFHNLPEDFLTPADMVDEFAAAGQELDAFMSGPATLRPVSRIEPLPPKDRIRSKGDLASGYHEAIGAIFALPTTTSELPCSVMFLPRAGAVEMTPYEARQSAAALLQGADDAEYGFDHQQRHTTNMEALGDPTGLTPQPPP